MESYSHIIINTYIRVYVWNIKCSQLSSHDTKINDDSTALELKQGYERAKNICLLSWIRYFSVLVPSLKSPWAECGAF